MRIPNEVVERVDGELMMKVQMQAVGQTEPCPVHCDPIGYLEFPVDLCSESMNEVELILSQFFHDRKERDGV